MIIPAKQIKYWCHPFQGYREEKMMDKQENSILVKIVPWESLVSSANTSRND